jgi:hypothetical protein
VPQLLRVRIDGLHAIVEHEHLTAALDLVQDRLAHQPSLYLRTSVMMGRRPGGGVVMVEMSRSLCNPKFSVRGMGVAVSVRISTARASL